MKDKICERLNLNKPDFHLLTLKSYKDALEMFQTAIKIEPWYMLHTYELAITYHEMGNDEYAIKFLKKAMELPQKYEDAVKCFNNCQTMLAKLEK